MRLLHVIVFLCVIAYSAESQLIPKQEMRGVWIATVENIDWPSSSLLTVERQREEMTELLDLVKEYHLNTVVLQIRPAADAFYPSALEPWSQWLTGQQGKAPEPWYDPLAFAIRECRKRGLDVHVWLNPYRAIRDTAVHRAAPDHVTNIHPEWFVTYGVTRYFDPGLPQTRDHVARVVSDIVRRYDIDAIHMDDYFYPYRIAGTDFPDDSSFAEYHGEYSETRRDDWRRSNVDKIIRQLHDSIKSIKPHVEFGISPFGVWRNRDRDSTGSATRAGQTNYDDLFADVLKWQKEGWIDYVAPQLYWQIGFDPADYKILAAWWDKNTYGCQLFVGHALYRLDPASAAPAWRSAEEIISQIRFNRSLENITGSIFFSAKFLRSNPLNIWQSLMQELYRYPAIQPMNKNISPINAGLPRNATQRRKLFGIELSWEKGDNTKYMIIYKLKKGEPANFSDPAGIIGITSDNSFQFRSNRLTRLSSYSYAITALSTTNLESEPVLCHRKKKQEQ